MAEITTDKRASSEPLNGAAPAGLPVRTSRGRALPLGATELAEGVNFALLCRHGTAVHLAIFPLDGATASPLAEIVLDPRKNRTGDHWHVQVKGLPASFR